MKRSCTAKTNKTGDCDCNARQGLLVMFVYSNMTREFLPGTFRSKEKRNHPRGDTGVHQTGRDVSGRVMVESQSFPPPVLL